MGDAFDDGRALRKALRIQFVHVIKVARKRNFPD
jgi:hypothetical protein